MDGFINIHRQLLESSVFASEKKLKIWIWLLLRASFCKRFIPLTIGRGQSEVKIERGQLIFGRFSAEESLNIDGSTIYKILQWFESEDMIKIESNSHYTIISICNYDTYQFNGIKKEQPSDSQVTTDEQQSNTYKKEIEIKKEYYNTEILINESSSEIERYKLFVKKIFGENDLKKPLDNILKFRDQMSFEQFTKLYAKYTQNEMNLFQNILSLQNDNKYCKGKTSLYLTLNNWANLEIKRKQWTKKA